MNQQLLQSYGIPLLIVVFFLWRFLRFRQVKKELPLLLEKGGIVVDVRTRGEFSAGSREGSINIPLDELQTSTNLPPLHQPIILCCASGARSGMAVSVLRSKGYKTVVNAGPWKNTIT